MPFGDGTGPMGNGPMTGRGFGLCRGLGRRMRFGRRHFYGVWNSQSKEDELRQMESEAAILEEEKRVLLLEIANLKKTIDEPR